MGLRAGSVALVALLAACGEDPCDYVLCDIGDSACVAAISEAVACRRGGDVLEPEVRFVNSADLLAEWEAEAEEPTAQELKDDADAVFADSLLGLMPRHYDVTQAQADSLSNFIGFYDDGEIVIIEDRNGGIPTQEYVLMVHELVHYYQDEETGLDELREEHATTLDRYLGLRAITEGEAELFEELAQAHLQGIRPTEQSWDNRIGSFQARMLVAAQQTSTPALDVYAFFPYAFGLEWEYDAWQAEGGDAVADQVLAPPESVREVIRGFAERQGFPNGDATLDLHAVPVLPGFTPFTGAHQGVWLINAMLQRTSGTDDELWFPALQHIDADFSTTLRGNDGLDLVVVWRISTAEPEGLIATLTAEPSSWWHQAPYGVYTVDGDVVLVATTADDADQIFEAIEGWTSLDIGFAGPPRRLQPMPPGTLGCSGR